MSSNFNDLMIGAKNCYQKFKFHPLYNEDGSPSYVRASLLAAFALSLILHVFLRPNVIDVSGQQDSGEINIVQGNSVVHKSFDPFNKSAQRTVNQGASLASQEQTVIASEDDGWSLFGFDSQEAKEHKQLVANRKQALVELSDGAAFLTSCGNINAGYIGCSFDFSKKVRSYYDSNIEAVADGFMITLVAKGNQQKDGCAKFVVNSEGVYQAYDVNGVVSQKCFADTKINNFIITHNSPNQGSSLGTNLAANH